MSKKKKSNIRVVNFGVVTAEILLVLDTFRVPAADVDQVFEQVKEQILYQPVTIGDTGLTQSEIERREKDMLRKYGLLKNRRRK